MTVSTDTRRVQYATNGTTGPFTVTFPFLKSSHLAVTYTDSAGADTLLTLNVNYTVSGSVVTTTLAYASGGVITIDRDIPITQELDLRDGDDFPAESVEEAFDKLTMIAQQVAIDSNRVLRVPEVSANIPLLPVVADRANKVLAFDANGDPDVMVPSSGSAADVLIQLANSASAAQGPSLVAYNPALAYAGGIGQFLNYQYARTAGEIAASVTPTAYYYPPGDVRRYGVVADGVTNDAPAIKRAFDVAAQGGVREIIFPSGTIKLLNANNDTAYTCAVVAIGLKKVRIRGQLGTKFIVGSGGGGSAEFGLFRFEQCEDVEVCSFEVDGSGITINGTGANRSRTFVLSNFNANTSADLPVLNKRFSFHNLYIHDVGGVLLVARRSTALASTPVTDGLDFYDNRIENALGQDGGVGLNWTRNARIYSNRFVNSTASAPMDSMTVDASQGCENVLIENNYGYGFMFGMKCETGTNQGPAANEIWPSKRVMFINNTLEEIGDPASFDYLGSETYGIKVNGINCIARGNTIKHRTVGVTTGGLASGIIVFNTHNDYSLCLIDGNYVKGCRYGYAHGDTTTPTARKATTRIVNNRTDDASFFGIVVTSNVTVEGNDIQRAAKAAINLQIPDRTIVRSNVAYNCGSVDSDFTADRVVYQQENNSAVGFFDFTDNHILDDRGASAAEYGYFLRGGNVAGNKYVFKPGYTTGILTGITFDNYFSVIGESTQTAGTTNRAPVTIRSSGIPSSTAPWSSRAWLVGDRAIREAQAVGQPKAWVCTTAGSPGTWTSEGNL